MNTNLCSISEPITRGRTKRREADSCKSYGRFRDWGNVVPEGTQMTHQVLEGNILRRGRVVKIFNKHYLHCSRQEDGDSGIRHKIVRILEEIPDQFELGEDEGDILKLVLDQGRAVMASLREMIL